MIAVDTNIWIYAHDTRDPAKQQTAQELVATVRPLVLLWQVGCEFIAASRKLEPLGFTRERAWAALTKMEALADEIFLPERELWADAKGLQDRFVLHFWDALLIAACARGGVKTLYSEDLQHGAEFGGVRIVNPFLPLPSA